MNSTNEGASASHSSAAIKASLKKRYARERRFQWYGRMAVLTGFVFLLVLLVDIVGKGYPAFTQQYIRVTVDFSAEQLGVAPGASEEQLAAANYLGVIKNSLRAMFPEVDSRKEKRQLYRLVSVGAEYQLRDMLLADPQLLGQTREVWLQAHSEAGSYLKGQVSAASAEADRKVKDVQMAWLDQLRAQGRTESRFNTTFFTAGDSREPEMADASSTSRPPRPAICWRRKSSFSTSVPTTTSSSRLPRYSALSSVRCWVPASSGAIRPSQSMPSAA